VNPLRIGLFTECYRPIQNGVVASVDALGDALRARGHTVIFVTPRMPGYLERRDDVVRVPSLPLPTSTAYRLTVPIFSGERIARALGRLSVVHTHSPFVTGWMGVRVAKRYRLPHVFTYHTQLEEYAHYVPFERRATRSAAAQLTRSYANSADAVIVPTAAMQRRLREIGVRARIEIVPTGIDVERFGAGLRRAEVRGRLGVRGDAKMVLSVGRLGREKNLELALETFARLDAASAQLVIVGDGAHREALEREAARLGVAGRTTFARELPREALPDVYASADAFLFTSSSETQGLVLVEALAADVPIVAVDTPATRDVLGGAGWIVEPEARALAAALAAALDGPRLKGRSARTERAVQRFGEEAMAGRVLAVYASLLEAGAA
jgi:glycosyltransferase involved in cell wall biosynthesis